MNNLKVAVIYNAVSQNVLKSDLKMSRNFLIWDQYDRLLGTNKPFLSGNVYGIAWGLVFSGNVMRKLLVAEPRSM